VKRRRDGELTAEGDKLKPFFGSADVAKCLGVNRRRRGHFYDYDGQTDGEESRNPKLWFSVRAVLGQENTFRS
jgi:hypothetical protein